MGGINVYETDNPFRDADRYDWECQRWLDTLPVCVSCGEPLDGKRYEMDGELYCARCLLAECEVLCVSAPSD